MLCQIRLIRTVPMHLYCFGLSLLIRQIRAFYGVLTFQKHAFNADFKGFSLLQNYLNIY